MSISLCIERCHGVAWLLCHFCATGIIYAGTPVCALFINSQKSSSRHDVICEIASTMAVSVVSGLLLCLCPFCSPELLLCYSSVGCNEGRCLACFVFRDACFIVTKRRSSLACTGNPKPEQETIKGTHAQETSAYQRRPTSQHAAQGSNPPRDACFITVDRGAQQISGAGATRERKEHAIQTNNQPTAPNASNIVTSFRDACCTAPFFSVFTHEKGQCLYVDTVHTTAEDLKVLVYRAFAISCFLSSGVLHAWHEHTNRECVVMASSSSQLRCKIAPLNQVQSHTRLTTLCWLP